VTAAAVRDRDPFDAARARGAGGVLAAFNDAGVLAPAEVHVARRLAALGGEPDEAVVLAAALAVRAPRLGHVFADLATIRETVAVDADAPVDVAALPWPDAREWRAALERSPLVPLPLRLEGTALYLDRYWREERQIADDLRALAASAPAGVRGDVLAAGLDRLFGADRGRQPLAAAAAVLRRFAVVAGGPGTGKTTTVARIVALLAEQAAAAGEPPPLVALAAPTGKAAARLEAAVHDEARTLDVAPHVAEWLLGLRSSTIHRLLGWRPGTQSRFRHDRGNRLPFDAVVVDESSMVSLSLVARLVESVRPDARLVLVGDPGQLTSIEAGAVLGDVVGPVADGLRMRAPSARALAEATGRHIAAEDPGRGVAVGDGIVVLDRVHRFGEAIGDVAAAVRRGDSAGVLALLAEQREGVTWIDADPADAAAASLLAPIREHAVATAAEVIAAAQRGDPSAALAGLDAFRVLCAHRRGEHGVATWMPRVEGWLADAIEGFRAEGAWYVGRPLLVTANDYGLRLFNGDTGVVVATGEGRVSAAFTRHGQVVAFHPARLEAVDTVYAMTIHKSQGSQFDTAAVVLPEPGSQILTRELLYTAVTRARKRLILAGTAEAVRAAVDRPIARASGLRERLWA
jgi:exodeoxyribonuclease V alpha subunit